MKNSWYFSLQFQSLNVFFAFRFWFVGLKYVESGREPTARFYTKNKFGNRDGDTRTNHLSVKNAIN